MHDRPFTITKTKDVDVVNHIPNQLILVQDPEGIVGQIYFDFTDVIRMPLGYIDDTSSYTNDEIDNMFKASYDRITSDIVGDAPESMNNLGKIAKILQDGSQKSNIVVFNPDGTPIGNIFNDFGAACEYALTLNQMEQIQFYVITNNTNDVSIEIPAGTYKLPPNVHFRGIGCSPQEFYNLCFTDGTKITGLFQLALSSVDIISSRTDGLPLITTDGAYLNLILHRSSIYAQDTSPIIGVINQARLQIDIINGSLISADAPLLKFDAISALLPVIINVDSRGDLNKNLFDTTGYIPDKLTISAITGAKIGDELLDKVVWRGAANEIAYMNSISQLQAKTMQEAIDVLANEYIVTSDNFPDFRNTRLWMPLINAG